MQLSLVLEQGVGVSLINSVPEELIFATLSGIRVSVNDFCNQPCTYMTISFVFSFLQIDFISSSLHQCLNATVQYIQV